MISDENEQRSAVERALAYASASFTTVASRWGIDRIVWTIFAVASIGHLACDGTQETDKGQGQCGSNLDVFVDNGARDGVASSAGNDCTAVTCLVRDDAGSGCAQWRGTMTSTDPSSTCTVSFRRSDGMTSSAITNGGHFCDGVPAERAFHVDSSGVVSSY